MKIKLLKAADCETTLTAINHLLPQLSSSAQALELSEWIHICEQQTVWGAFADETMIGTLTLCEVKIAATHKAWIEDVVVDSQFRGQGIAAKLIHTAIQFASKNGIQKIDLTSQPNREVANHLYQKLGFQLRETNVYRLKLN